MHILVTGSQGYIGYPLVRLLHEQGHTVTGLDIGYYADGTLFESPWPPGVRQVWKDIRAINRDDLTGFDAICHLAELSNDPLGQHNEANTYAINHAGTVRLARLAKEMGIERFVYTSSCSVYGLQNGEAFKTEVSPTHPLTAYARCKVNVETDLSALADDTFSPTFLRNATAYGPSPRQRFDIVLNNLSGYAYTTGTINMRSDGTPWRPLVHIADIAQAIACTLEDGARQMAALYQTIDLTPEIFSFRAFTRLKQLKYLLDTGQLDGRFFWREGVAPDAALLST